MNMDYMLLRKHFFKKIRTIMLFLMDVKREMHFFEYEFIFDHNHKKHGIKKTNGSSLSMTRLVTAFIF